MDTIAKISTLHDGNELSVEVEIGESSTGKILIGHINMEHDGVKNDISFEVDLSINSISMVLDPTLTGIMHCIAACAAGAIMGPLVDCFNKDIKIYIQCLKTKGVIVTKALAKCIAGCLLKGAIGS